LTINELPLSPQFFTITQIAVNTDSLNAKKASTAFNTFLLVVANAVGSLLGFLRSVYIAHFLSPIDYGSWMLLVTSMNYANYADMGINNGAIMEAPKLIGQKKPQEAQTVLRQSYTAILLASGIVSFLLLFAALMPWRFTLLPAESLLVVAAASLVFALMNYNQLVARIEDRFGLIGCSAVLSASISLGAVILIGKTIQEHLVILFGIAFLLGSGMGALVLGLVVRPSWIWPPKKENVVRLIKIGIPVTLLPIGFTLYQSIDRWIVAWIVPAEALGYYGLGATMGIFLYMLPNMLAMVLFTKQIEQFGSTGDVKTLESLVYPPFLFCGYCMAFIAGGLILLLPFILRHFFPAYLAGSGTITLQMVANCLLFPVPVAANFLISTDRKAQLLILLLLGTVTMTGLVFLFASSAGIEGAATAVLISYLLYGVTLTLMSVKLLGGTLSRQILRCVFCFFPFVICIPIAILLLQTGPLTGNLWNDVICLVRQLALFIVFCLPLFLLFGWFTGILTQPFVASLFARKFFSTSPTGSSNEVTK
jgi:O-antigen/teichoic acid export membrane protein